MGEKSYVKLTKEQEASLQDVTPGELNQPIDVHKLRARRCPECGQTLPPSYEPPSDEDWSTGIFGCADDPESCVTGLFCPCVLFGRNIEKLNDEITSNNACMCHVMCIEGGMTLATLTAFLHGMDPGTSCLITEGLLFAWWMCGIYTGMARQSLQRKYHLKDAPCDPCVVHCCFHWCALCQEHREMKARLADNDDDAEETVVTPPLVQEMKVALEQSNKAVESHSSSSSSSSTPRKDGEKNEDNKKNNMELQVV